MEKKYLSRREMAQALGLSLSSVDRGWKAGIPPFSYGIKIGRRVLFPIHSLNLPQAGELYGNIVKTEASQASRD